MRKKHTLQTDTESLEDLDYGGKTNKEAHAPKKETKVRETTERETGQRGEGQTKRRIAPKQTK